MPRVRSKPGLLSTLFDLVGFCVVALFIGACGSAPTRAVVSSETVDCDSVTPDQLIQRYKLVYDGEEDKTYVEAAFTRGHPLGPYVRIASPCTLSDTASTLYERLNLTPLYIARSAGAQPHTFTLVDSGGNTITNTASISAVSFELPPASISLESTTVDFGFSPGLDTSSWISGDVFLEFVDSKTNTQGRLRVSARTGGGSGLVATTISVNVKNSAFAALFPPGQPVYARLVREVFSSISGAGATMGGGGSIRLIYATAYQSVDVNS